MRVRVPPSALHSQGLRRHSAGIQGAFRKSHPINVTTILEFVFVRRSSRFSTLQRPARRQVIFSVRAGSNLLLFNRTNKVRQIVLYQLTEQGRTVCSSHHIDPGPSPRESLEHSYWVKRTAEHFERKGYEMSREHPIKGNGAIDILAERPGQRVAVEVETGKSDIRANVRNAAKGDFDRVVLVATSPEAVEACRKVVEDQQRTASPAVELMTWLDVS